MVSKNKRKSGKLSGGGCGCGAANDATSNNNANASDFGIGGIFKGGSSDPASFNGVPLHSFYGEANQNNNPLNNQVASRLVSGGKKNKKNKTKTSSKSQNKRKTQNKRKIIKRKGGAILMTSSPKFELLNTNTMI